MAEQILVQAVQPRARRRGLAWPLTLALLFVGLVTCVAIFGPIFATRSYHEIDLEAIDKSPCRSAWFGTDELGRDLFVRTCYGARISLFVGVSATLIDLIVGVVWGGCAAFAGGRIDGLMMRIADLLYSVPYLLVVILLTVVWGSGLLTIILAMTITGWINMARLVRGQVLQTKQMPFVSCARLLGASRWRILTRHLIPNATGPIIAMVTFTIPTAIFTEAFLSFVGLGIQAPIASWGVMVGDGLSALQYAPWRLLIPASLLCTTLFALHLIGDGIRDALDPS